MLSMSEVTVTRFRREGLLVRLSGLPSYSRSDVQAFIDNPWINTVQAALVLQVSHARVSQLAAEDKIPVHHTPSGQRMYRLAQLEVVARARRERRSRSSSASSTLASGHVGPDELPGSHGS